MHMHMHILYICTGVVVEWIGYQTLQITRSMNWVLVLVMGGSVGQTWHSTLHWQG